MEEYFEDDRWEFPEWLKNMTDEEKEELLKQYEEKYSKRLKPERVKHPRKIGKTIFYY